jgi:hypothetical protein
MIAVESIFMMLAGEDLCVIQAAFSQEAKKVALGFSSQRMGNCVYTGSGAIAGI